MTAADTPAGERAARRERILDQAIAAARVRGNSIRCGGLLTGRPVRHAGEPGGCENNGRNCLCECHDATAPR